MKTFPTLGLASLLLSGGCATIVCGPEQQVTIESSPSGATVQVRDQTVVTPATVTLKRKEAYTVRAAKPGFYDGYVRVRPVENPWIWGNFLWDLPTSCLIMCGTYGPVIVGPGSITDRVTGAGYRLDPDKVHVNLEARPPGETTEIEQARDSAEKERSPHVVATIPVEGGVGALTTGAGSVWVRSGFWHAKISRIDPRTNKVVATHTLPEHWRGALVDDEGIWVITRPLFGSWILCKVDLESGQVTATVPLGLARASMAVGEGAVWVLTAPRDRHQPCSVLRIDSKTAQVQARILLGPANRKDLRSGIGGKIQTGQGVVWVSTGTDHSLQRIDPETNQVSATNPLPVDASVCEFGNNGVWALQAVKGVAQVTHIEPANGETHRPIPFGGQPSGRIAVGQGAVWVVNGEDQSLLWIEEGTGEVAKKPLPVGGHPRDVVFAAGAVWVGTEQGVVRVAPR